MQTIRFRFGMKWLFAVMVILAVPVTAYRWHQNRVYRILNRRVDMTFSYETLFDLYNYLAEDHQLPVVLTIPAYPGSGIGPLYSYTLNYRGRDVVLGDALHRMLRQQELDYIVADDAVVILTLEELEKRQGIKPTP